MKLLFIGVLAAILVSMAHGATYPALYQNVGRPRQSRQAQFANPLTNLPRPNLPSVVQPAVVQGTRRPLPFALADPRQRFQIFLTDVRARFGNVRNRFTDVRNRFAQGIPRFRGNVRNIFGPQPTAPVQPAAAAAAAPVGNRRRSQLPAVFFKKAEDIPGYEKFTLDEVVVQIPEILARKDNADEVTYIETEKTDNKFSADSQKQPTDFELRRR